jgi:uncharacterized repeat protein (TIGR03833 family)
VKRALSFGSFHPGATTHTDSHTPAQGAQEEPPRGMPLPPALLPALLLLLPQCDAARCVTTLSPCNHFLRPRLMIAPLVVRRAAGRARGGPRSPHKSSMRGRGRSGSGGRGRQRSSSRTRTSPTPRPRVGDTVSVVQKQYYGTDERSVGIVARVLTRAAEHPRGHKVRLEDGIVGRCTELLQRGTARPEETSRAEARYCNRGPAAMRRSDEPSSDDMLAELFETPAPGIRLRDVE